VLQQVPERRDVVHVRELRGAGEVPRTQPHGALDAELDVDNGDARGCLRAEAHGARRGNLDAGLLLVVGALEEGLRASVPRVHACAEVAEVVRRLLDAHDAAERLDGDGELVTRAVGAHGRLPVHRAHVAGGHAMLVVAVQADVEEGPIVHALQGVGVGRRGHELVLPLLQLDGQGVAHDARLDLVHCCELEQGLLARGVQQLEAVDAGDARRPHGSLEHAAVHLDLFRALLRAADVLHAAARAIAALDGDLGLGLEAREVEVLLERRHAEVVDDVAHEARHARVVVRAVDEAAHEADLERHVGVGEGDEVLDEREAEQVHVRGEEDVEVHGGAPREQVLEEAQQLVAGRPRRHLGGALLDPEREVLHDVEHVVQVLHGDVLERGELQVVVLDERHAVLVHAEEDLVVVPPEHQPAHDVSDVLHGRAPGEVFDLDDLEEEALDRAWQEGGEEHDVELLELRRERQAGLVLLGEQQELDAGGDLGRHVWEGGCGVARGGRRAACGPVHCSLGENAAGEQQRRGVDDSAALARRLRSGRAQRKSSKYTLRWRMRRTPSVPVSA
jgi:hypothetical protein